MAKAIQKDLKFISELKAARIADMAAGVSAVERTGHALDDLLAKVAIDRLTLGASLHREARAALTRNRPSFRNAISRGYYAMYQTLRGVVFLTNRGDDHEKHSELPGHLPNDFPARAFWENALKSARLERNRADYEPYPRSDAAFKTAAITVCKDSQQLRAVARGYFRARGLMV